MNTNFGRNGVVGGLLAGLLAFVAWPTTPNASMAPCDNDGDGHTAIHCGGDDCDDNDANRYPGNVEVCDAGTHDEDCDPTTFGRRDMDQDGLVDVKCCNIHGSNVYCGNDCDDANAAITTGQVKCNGATPYVCGADGEYDAASCFSGTTCIPQPNDTGVCGVAPPGYKAPATWTPHKRPTPVKKTKQTIPKKLPGNLPTPTPKFPK